MRRPLAPLAALALLAPLAASACSGGSDDPGDLASDWSVRSALAQLPADVLDEDGAQPLVSTADLVAAEELAGVERPAGDDPEALGRWLADLSAASPDAEVLVPFPSGFEPRADLDQEALVGWSWADVDAFAAIDSPPDDFAVVSGEALEDDPLSPDLVEVEDGVVSDGEGEDRSADLQALDERLSRTGILTRLAARDGAVALGRSTDVVRAWLDDDADTLADEEAMSDLAEALDDAGVYAAVLTPAATGEPLASLGGGRLSPDQAAELAQEIAEDLVSEQFDAVGLGWGLDDDGAVVTVAYRFATPSAADDAVDSVHDLWESGTSVVDRRPFADRFEVGEAESADAVVTVSLRPTDAGVGTPLQMLASRDLPFVSP